MLTDVDHWIYDMIYTKKKFELTLIYNKENNKWYIKNLICLIPEHHNRLFDAANINTKNFEDYWYHYESKNSKYWENKWIESNLDDTEQNYFKMSINVYDNIIKKIKPPIKNNILSMTIYN